MRTLKLAIALILVMFSLTLVAYGKDQQSGSVDIAETGVLKASREVLEAFKSQDGKRLATLVHPKKGVRFSPSAYVDTKSDLVFSRARIERFWSDNKTYTWGSAEGTGEPIKMTPRQYYRKYIMDQDFLKPSSISVNNDRAHGNTTNNAASVYPEGTRVEYYIEPSRRKGISQLDWAALRLVSEKIGNDWFLVGVIHDEWTP